MINKVKKPAIVTLAIGNKFLRMSLALMNSAYAHYGDNALYVIFCANVRKDLFKNSPWIIYEDIEQNYPLENRYSARRYKAVTLNHAKYRSRDVLFLDADSIVYDNKFPYLFDTIRQKSALIYGHIFSDNEIWRNDKEAGIEFVLKDFAKKAGFDVVNLHNNSGIMGRASDRIGLKFATLYQELLDARPLEPFTKASRWISNDDEAYSSIAFQLATNGLSHGQYKLDQETYITTAQAFLTDIKSGWPTVNKNNTNQIGRGTAIIHFVEMTDTYFYRRSVRRLAPLSTKGKLVASLSIGRQISYLAAILKHYLKKITPLRIAVQKSKKVLRNLTIKP